MKLLSYALLLLLISSCSDKTVQEQSVPPPPRISSPDASINPDARLLDWQPVPELEPDMSFEERCALVAPNDTEQYCRCYPECCDNQRWYCPPNPRQTIDVMQVVVEVCDENRVPCTYGHDFDCPPPEILTRSDCYTQWECPPGTSGEFIEWFECQLEDGTLGRQQVLCNKGNLLHLPCRPCNTEECNGEDDDCDNAIDEGRYPCETSCGEGWGFCIEAEIVDCNASQPGEERCNYEDDDCDGLIDEGQRNVCDICGPVPADICDGDDNDCDGAIDEDLVRECETACERGLETCDGGNWISCTATQPADEECDGADNDCDGQIDEQLDCLCTVSDVGNLMPCTEPPLLCGQGFKTCECADPECTEMRMTDCAAICSYLPFPGQPPCDPLRGIALEQEECNNFDEDCDQFIDENLIQACYTGDPTTLFIGVCTPGEAYCHQGAWGNHRPPNNEFEPGLCIGEITPQEEICNGADDDCDGVVDYGEDIRETDILFIVDWSGSMDDEIEAVKIALNRFATHFAAEEPLQWGLIVGPKEFEEDGDEYLLKVSDISPFDQFLASFAALGNEGMDTGSEMLLDALYFAVQNISGAANVNIPETQWVGNTSSRPVKENFSITWRPNAERIVIVFSDEVEQSFLRHADRSILGSPINKAVVEAAIRAGISLKVYAFSSGGGFGNRPNHWEDIVLAGSGTLFNLSSNAVSMYNDLMSIIDEACLPRELEQMGYNMSYGPYDFANYDMTHLM